MSTPLSSPVACVGTAGWAVPVSATARGTHLQRYARVLRGVEINSSFYRPHAPATYERWASATPPEFRFAVKVPRSISHDQRLTGTRDLLARFLDETAGLGTRRGPLLLQLPPSFGYDARTVGRFLALLRRRYEGTVVVEPRHASWFASPAEALLTSYRAARVGADPAVVDGAAAPAAWPGVCYFRLHGSPRIYWSSYTPEALTRVLVQLRHAMVSGAEAWCIFDNTAGGAAYPNARVVHQRLARGLRRTA